MIRSLLCAVVLGQPLAAQPELAAARNLIHAVPGDLPTTIGYLNVAELSWRLSDVMRNAPNTVVSAPTPIFQIRFAHGWIMVDAAMTREDAIAAKDTSRFFDSAYSRAIAALRGAGLIVVTHEHYDHVGLAAHSEVADELAPKTMLTRAQMESMLHNKQMAVPPFDSTRAGRYIVFDYDRVLPIAQGVVLIKAPGHTPGSQMVYVKLASGREVILSGDVALHHIAIDQEPQKPDTTGPRRAERELIAHEVAWLHEAQRAGVSVVISHDGEQLKSLARKGILREIP